MAQRRFKKRSKQKSFFERVNPLYLLAGFFALLLVVAGGLYLAQSGSSPTPAVSPPAIPKSQSNENIPYPNVARISAAEAKAKLDRQEIVMIDSRSAQEYAASHILGAKSIPLAEIENRLTELPRDKEIVTYCT